MSVRFRVTDRNGKFLSGQYVFVSWETGGQSDGRTDAEGLFDTRSSGGRAKYVSVNGKVQMENAYLEDRTYTVNDR